MGALLRFSYQAKLMMSRCIILQCMVMYIVFLLACQTNDLFISNTRQLQNVTEDTYKLNDRLFDEEERIFFDQPNNTALLHALYAWLSNHSAFDYFIASHQYVVVEGRSDIPDKFKVSYGSGREMGDILHSLQVDAAFLEHFAITVEEGRLFEEADYIFSRDKKFPVLLGSEYAQLFQLGDELKIDYVGDILDCYVSGFLTQGSYYSNTYDLQNLDRFIVLPSFIFNETGQTPADKELNFIVYLDKCSGFLYSDKTSAYLQGLIDQKCYALDIKPYQLEMQMSLYPSIWGLEGEKLGRLWLIFSIVFTGITVLCVSMNQAAKLMRLKTDYAVFIANGYRKSTVCLAIILENLWINGFAALTVLLFGKALSPQIPALPLLLLCISVAAGASIYPLLLLSRVQIAKSIRGEPS